MEGYIPDANAPLVVVTYRPDGDGSFTYSDQHKAYTNDLSKLAAIPGPRQPVNGPMVDDVQSIRNIDVNKFDVSDAVATLIQDCTSEATRVRLLWQWLTLQDIHGTVYKLTEEFDEVEYQLQKLKNVGESGGNTYAALFALLCAYAKIPCVVIRGYVKGSLYTVGQPITSKHMAEWNAVYVDGSWRLLDLFWGACCKNPDEMILSDTSDWYLFTEPRQFLYSHYPETAEWQLVDKPITLQEFAHQPFLKDRFFTQGMQDSVTPSTNIVSTNDGEVNILFPLDSERAKFQEFRCLIKQLQPDGSWEKTDGVKKHHQHDFMYLMKDGDMITLSIYVRFPKEGTFKVEIIGKEVKDSANELNEFDWVAVYRVEVKNLQKQVNMFPQKPTIGWGPGDKLREIGIEAVSHQEGMIKFFPEDQLLMEFKVRGDVRYKSLRLRDKLHMKNGEFLPQTSQVQDDEWYSKDTDRSIKFTVPLKVAADYMLHICAEVDGRDVGSVCNYLIVCVGEIIDKVLEEIKKLRPRLTTAMNKKNLYDLRRLTSQIKSKALHRHAQMRDLYNEAITVLGSLEAREEIMRKLRALDIPKVIRELKGYKQVPDSSVVEVMKATFLLLGVNEKELNGWETIRQRILVTDGAEGLAGKVQGLKETMADFINDKRNKPAIRRVDYLLGDINTEDMERISLAVVPLLEVIKLIVDEYKTANPTVFGRSSTVIEDNTPVSPTTPSDGGTLEEPVFEQSTEDDNTTENLTTSEFENTAEELVPEPYHANQTNLADADERETLEDSLIGEPSVEVASKKKTDRQRTPEFEMIPLSPRVEL